MPTLLCGHRRRHRHVNTCVGVFPVLTGIASDVGPSAQTKECNMLLYKYCIKLCEREISDFTRQLDYMKMFFECLCGCCKTQIDYISLDW